jgi:hypothetical protein
MPFEPQLPRPTAMCLQLPARFALLVYDLMTLKTAQDSLDARFQALTGRTSVLRADKPPTRFQPSSKLSEEQQVSSLLDQISLQVSLETAKASTDQDDEARLHNRLVTLQNSVGSLQSNDRPSNTDTNSTSSPSMTKSKKADNVVPANRAPMESVDDKLLRLVSQVPKGRRLGMCTICTDRGMMRCAECDGDVYCAPCFLEVHRAVTMSSHQPS